MVAETDKTRCVVMGAGPAGLTAAYDLAGADFPAVVFERDRLVGGLARTVEYKGYRFDIGGHRFFTKVDRVHQWWMEIMADDFMVRPRMSRIYYNDRYFNYPLQPLNALRGLGIFEAARCGLSFLRAQIFPQHPERSLEQWVSNRFGARLYSIFFKTYTEKVWGMPCTEISADWAAQRIKNLDLLTAVKDALFGQAGGREVITTLIGQFHYPRLGPGMLWERVAKLLAQRGVTVNTGMEVVRVHHDGERVLSIGVRDEAGDEHEEHGSHFLSSLPIREFLNVLDPPPPDEILAAGNKLRYRDFLTVGLVLAAEEPFPDNWIYVHSPGVRVGRIQNFKAWSPEMVPEAGKGCIGLEYFVQEGDELWGAPDDELIALAIREVEELGLLDRNDVLDGVVIRMPKAYPIYDHEYEGVLEDIREWLECLGNLQLVGRNGQHRYNNQDHSMMTAMLAAENILGANHDIWDVNVDEDYHEEISATEPQVGQETHQQRGGDRLVPQSVEIDPLLDALSRALARFDPVALGSAIGVLLGTGIFAATAVLLLQGGEVVGPQLSLLSNYFLGFEVSWWGAFLGLVEAAALGFGFGFVLAKTINVVVSLHEYALMRRLEMRVALEVVERDS